MHVIYVQCLKREKDILGIASLGNYCNGNIVRILNGLKCSISEGSDLVNWFIHLTNYQEREGNVRVYPHRASSSKVSGKVPLECIVYVMTLPMMLGNGSGTDFGASQCIPMGPCC